MNDGQPPTQRPRRAVLATARAVFLGFVVLLMGGSVSGALMIANLKLAPTLPLFFLSTVLWLWLLWAYMQGDGWPRSASDWRRHYCARAGFRRVVWGWALVAGGLPSRPYGNRLHPTGSLSCPSGVPGSL